MAQIATTKTTAEAAGATADRSAGTVRATAPQGTKPMLRLVEPTKGVTKRDPVSFWLQLAGEQMVQNIEVMGKLATSRHWPEALVIQQGFAQASYARMARGMARHLGWRA
jgi:hypothetical protein